MSDNGPSSRRRGVLTHWVPLVLTLTIATAGVAAWAWSQRNRGDDEDYEDDAGEHSSYGAAAAAAAAAGGAGAGGSRIDYDHADYGDNPPYGVSTPQPGTRDTIDMTESASAAAGSTASWSARMTGALGGRSSPQHWVGSASKAVSAGLTAASAAVGGALAAIREDDKDAYADHETWSEEVDARKDRPTAASAGASAAAAMPAFAKDSKSGRKRKTVAIVVSAEHYVDAVDDTFHENASILSYIPRQTDFSRTRIFVLVYAPGLKDSTLLDPNTSSFAQPNSLSSSFSNIAADVAQSPKQEARTVPSANAAYNALHAQALALVEKENEIIPFTSPNGHAHILHLLEPDVVYLQESLAGDDGATVNQLQNWMRNDIIVVVGTESGYGGLADSESEAEKLDSAAPQKWWQRADRVGIGRGVVVVDGVRVHDDWVRRVEGKE